MSFGDNYGLEKIKVSDKLDDVIKNTIKNASHDKRKKRIRKNILKLSASVASLFIVFVFSINISPIFAKSLNGIPIISSISNALIFSYDKNIVNAEKQNVKETKTDKGIGITINNIVADDKDLFIMYTLNGGSDKNSLKNLLLENFSLKDKYNNIILDGNDFKSEILPVQLDKKNEDYIILSNMKYKCIISSLGNSLQNYSANKKTYGTLELISIGGKIPDEINLNINSLTEAYAPSYSNNFDHKFNTKFGRNPITLKGSWNFNVKINDNLKSIKPEVYSNINFSANNTDFNLEYVKIYPTHIDTRIKLGENKLDKTQCWAIGRILGSDQSKLPYLIDENGTKYFISGNALTNIDSNNCMNLSYESCYFNKSKELYLVISQLNYMNSPFVNITPIKIKIK